MKKLILALIVVALGALLTTPAFAFGPGAGRGHGNGPGYYRDATWAKLNLSDEQKTKIEALQMAYQKEIRPISEKISDKSVALRRLWLQANPDKDKITAIQKEVRTLRDTMQDKVTAMKLEIRKVLTPEQNEKLANAGWGRGSGFGTRNCMRGSGRGNNEFVPGMGML